MAIHREPLVPPIDDAHVEADVRELFRANTEKGYQDASFMRLLGHRPEILTAFVPLREPLIERLADYEHGPFTRQEKLALRLAETIARDPNALDPELAEALHAEFSDAQRPSDGCRSPPSTASGCSRGLRRPRA